MRDRARDRGFSVQASVLMKRGRCSGHSGKFQDIFKGTFEQCTEPPNAHMGPWNEQVTWPQQVQNFPEQMNKTFCFTSMLPDQTDGDLQYLFCHTSSKHLINTAVLAVIK